MAFHAVTPAWILAALLALAPAAPAARAAGGDPSPAAERPGEGPAHALLEAALARGDAGSLEGELRALGPAAAREMLDLLAARALADGRPLGPALERALEQALAAVPLPVLRVELGANAAADASAPARLAATRVLGAAGEARDVALLARLAGRRPDERGVPLERRRAFEHALAAMLGRDRAALDALRAAFPGLDPSLCAPAARTVGAAGGGDALIALAGMLGRVEGADAAVLAEIARAADRAPSAAARSAVVHVRYHLSATDESEAALAARALGALEDYQAVPDLIALLDPDRPRLAAAAHDALRAITRRGLPASRRAWEAWHVEERAWWDERSSAALADLSDPDPTLALRAMRSLAARGLYRDELAGALAATLERPEEELVRSACAILGQLGSAEALPALCDALERDPSIAAPAARALEAITGRRLPPDAEAWRAALGPENLSRGI